MKKKLSARARASVVRHCERIIVDCVERTVDDRIWEYEFGENGGKFDRAFRAFSRVLLDSFHAGVREASRKLRRALRRRRSGPRR